MPPFLPQKSFRSDIRNLVHSARADATPSPSLSKLLHLAVVSLFNSHPMPLLPPKKKKKTNQIVLFLSSKTPHGCLLPVPVWATKPSSAWPQPASPASPPTIPFLKTTLRPCSCTPPPPRPAPSLLRAFHLIVAPVLRATSHSFLNSVRRCPLIGQRPALTPLA